MPDFGIMRGFNEKLFGDKLVAGQLPTQLGLIGSQIAFDFDLDALAFFDRVTAAGGSLSATEKSAVNVLVIQMKADGTWTPMKAIYPMVGASAAACAQNLKSSSFTGSFTSGWTFASSGVTPNGTSAYMDTGFNFYNEFATLGDLHFSYYSRTNDSAAGYEIGLDNSQLNIICNYAGGGTGYISYSGNGSFATANSTGLYLGSVKSGTFKGYKNNVTVVNRSQSSITLPNKNTYLACDFRASPLEFSTKECAFSSFGDGLTDTQSSNYYTAVQAMQTTLSRQV